MYVCVCATDIGGWVLLNDGARETANFGGPLKGSPPFHPPQTMATSFATDAYIFKRNSSIDEPEDTEVQVLREQRGGQLVCDGIFKKFDQKGLRGSAAGHQEV